MGFWEEVNKIADEIAGVKDPTDSQGLPLGGDIVAPDTSTGDALSPDAVGEAYGRAGYQGNPRNDPYAVDPSELQSVISSRPSPFTVIDIDPGMANGTRRPPTGVSYSGIQGRFQATQATITKIANVLNIPSIQYGALLSFANQIGVTYELQLSGNSLRVEHLPQGFYPTPKNEAIASLPQNVSTNLLINDVYAQNLLQILLGGIFIQFESNDNPVFVAKPGETYDLVYSRVYVTTFGSAGRWRVISGNNAVVTGETDDRVLRQSLHMWDGSGMLDNPMYHPRPFSVNVAGSPQIDPIPSYVPANYIPNVEIIATNYDDGSALTRQTNGNIVGQVINKGYAILWITNLNFRFKTLGNNAQSVRVFYGLLKMKGNPYAKTSGFNMVPCYNALYWNSFYLQSATPGTSIEKEINFNTPVRIVLAGFDQPTDPSITATDLSSGESLIFWMMSLSGTSYDITSGECSCSGYILGGYQDTYLTGFPGAYIFNPSLLPYNPYPIDVNLPVTP
jgi:hypothetical protein